MMKEHSSGVRVKLGNDSFWEVDIAISAVGRWTNSLLAKLDIQLTMEDADLPGRIGCSFLGYTSPAPLQLRSNLITPEINIRPDDGGRLLLQVPDLDHLTDPKQTTPTDGLIGIQMMNRLVGVMRNSEGVRLERIAVGQRARLPIGSLQSAVPPPQAPLRSRHS